MVTKTWHKVGIAVICVVLLIGLVFCVLVCTVGRHASERARSLSTPSPTFTVSAGIRSPLPTQTRKATRPVPTRAPIVTSMPSPTPTPRPLIDVTAEQLQDLHDKMTSIEWEAYEQKVLGGRVRWTGTVGDATNDYYGPRIWVWLTDGGEAYLSVTAEEAASVKKGDVITFEGTITSSTWNWYSYTIEEVVILQE